MAADCGRRRVDGGPRRGKAGGVLVEGSGNASEGKGGVRLQAGARSVTQAGRAGRWETRAAPGTLVSATDRETGVICVMMVPEP